MKPGPYIALNRRVEMYSWMEEKSTESKKNIGGSETKKTTYSYDKNWSEDPKDSKLFRYPEGHYNPPKTIDNYGAKVSDAKVRDYNLNLQKIRLPSFQKLTLKAENLQLKDDAILIDNYLYQGKGELSNPQIGDLRLSYSILPRERQVTIFGKFNGNNNIDTYTYKQKINFYRMFSGTRMEAISTLKSEHNFWTWFWRFAGFLMMWIGLGSLVEPINVILDVFPFFSSISRGLSGVSTFIIAFILSTMTILVSSLLHNLIALTITLLIVFGIIIARKKINN